MSKPTMPKDRDELIELRAQEISDAVGWGIPYAETSDENKAMARRAARATLEAEEAAGVVVVPVACTAAQAVAMSDAAIDGGVKLPASSAATTFAYAAAVASSPYAKREGW